MSDILQILHQYLPDWMLSPTGALLTAGLVIILVAVGGALYRHFFGSQVISAKSPLMRERSSQTIQSLQNQQISKKVVKEIYRLLKKQDVSQDEYDINFRKFSERFSHLRQSLVHNDSEDSLINKLKERAWEEIEKGEFQRAEQYLKNAYKRDIAAMEDPNELRNSRQMSSAQVQADLAELKLIQFDYEEAAQCFRRAADQVPAGTFYDASKIRFLNQCGIAYLHAWHLDLAEHVFLESQKIQDTPPLELDPQISDFSQEFARFYAEQGRLDAAEMLFKRALHIEENLAEQNKDEGVDLADMLSRLGYLYVEKKRYTEAEPLFKRALEIRKDVLGADDPDIAASINDLAELYVAMENYEKAEELYHRVMNLRETVHGPQHPDVARNLIQLGALYQKMGRYKEAGPAYTRAIKIQEDQLGVEHPDLAVSLQNLGSLLEMVGKYQKAEVVFQKALKIAKKAHGEAHSSVGHILTNMAKMNTNLGNYDKAETLFQQAIHVWETSKGPKHRDTAEAYRAYSEMLFAAEKLNQAEEYEDKAKLVLGNKE